ncbi:bifunctional [glutamine synthetase] adenylyltransferase/[glutamine synthetase]-adenylyl-L-tyrosine phosphorylase [Catenulispora pinisilvae]|uniref:bifunctional [glutamine synthetase] adenylyltransferase/[glutamine synthetase]-adenylyl-L-tyrosine phosphorylase n=1 Tax=Catenulispora pinisilvae TaxID=2705253 RepID=UPI001891A3C1|nr:bifunctional [glutamine synthetase] adenylyltransferase/[glutamine synthetase]-adenylyl-L-tyrosine phosphorylase [Catenulispora pinisilvae]
MAQTAALGRGPESARSRLVRLGFTDPESALQTLAEAPLGELSGDPLFLEAIGRTADPDQALAATGRLLAAAGDAEALAATLAASKPFQDRLLGVLGVSVALGDHLERHPDAWHGLVEFDVEDLAPAFRRLMLAAVGADPDAAEPVADMAGIPARDALRVAYRDALLGISARDIGASSMNEATATYDQTAADLSDLATATLEAALAVARAELPEDYPPARLAVIAMGKCGARELNYVSDVDVVFVAAAPDGTEQDDEHLALRTATQLAATMMRVCSDTTSEGAIWQVDANLRPEGKNGPLVRSLASHVAYYERWAKTWEFQALLKARAAAGDRELGAKYVEAVTPMVWAASRRAGFVADVQSMRRRVVAHIPAKEAERELKLGSGGLRDIEFAVQLLQLVHGPTDPALRKRGTLESLAALSAGGYVGRTDAAALADAYRFLRTLEHRLQIHRLRRTHTLPEEKPELRRLGRSMGFRKDPVDQLNSEWKRHKREVRRLHEKLFYRPLLDAVARLTPGQAALGGAVHLTPEAAQSRLEALGYTDPAGALRHLTALTSGVSRRAAIQRTLLPVMLDWFADAADPDGGLLAFRKASEALGDTHWYLRLLRDEGAAAEHLARVLASGRYAPDLLLRAPEAVAILGDPANLVPRARPVLEAEILSAVGRASTPEAAVAAARAVRRRELFRIAAADLLGLLTVEQIGDGLSAVTAATLSGALQAATTAIENRLGGPLPTRFAIIAAGRFGGRELGYGSDADVLFVHDPLPDGAEAANPDEPAGGAPDNAVAAANGTASVSAASTASAASTESAASAASPAPTTDAAAAAHVAGPASANGSPASARRVSPQRERAATDAAHAVANELRRLLQIPTPDPPLIIDADLRPEGRQGPLVRTFASYAEYYRRWSDVWEAQALLRAEPVAGDPELGRRFEALIDPLRRPRSGLDETAVREIRRIKARVEAERLPRGADKAMHTKLGPGGLSDVEWTVQLLQLCYAHEVPALQTTRTRLALSAAVDAGLLESDDAEILDEAWIEATRVRNGIMLVRGRAGDSIPNDIKERAGIAMYLGSENSEEFVEEYRRGARRARAVVERVFYDWSNEPGRS